MGIMAQDEQQGEQPEQVAREPAVRERKPRDMDGKPRERRQREPQEKKQSEFEEKVLFINRTSKVTTGGRKFSFAALAVVGDGKGRIGFGFGKAPELADAIRKGGEQARKRLMRFEKDGDTIPHEITVDWDGARVLLKPAAPGTGIVAGSKVRSVLALAGIKDVVAKSLGSSNPLNLVRATMKALVELRSRAQVSTLRGVSL
jgi:small subunit ribosomal protein S5